MMSRRLFMGLVAGMMLGLGVFAAPARADGDGARAFVQDLGNRVIALLEQKDQTSFADREAGFRELLVSGFDIRTISRFVLGSRWRDLSAEELDDYQAVFTDFVVRVYAKRFDGYNGEGFDVLKTVNDMDGDWLVRARVVLDDSRPPVDFDFRVRENEGSYKIIDVYVEGTSMLITQRSEFAAVIDRSGVEGLIAELHNRVEAPVETTEQ